jgi:hypothetical protein
MPAASAAGKTSRSSHAKAQMLKAPSQQATSPSTHRVSVDIFGFTAKCRTSGSPLDNTSQIERAFHLITVSYGKSGVLLTPVVTTILCAGDANMITSGNVTETITQPPVAPKAVNDDQVQFDGRHSGHFLHRSHITPHLKDRRRCTEKRWAHFD